METNSKKVLEALPDFEKFMDLAREIKKISFDRMLLENGIKKKESDTFKLVMTDPKYFINGKAVPVSYYDNAFKFCGIDGELIEMRNQLAELVSQLELKRSEFEVYNRMHELYKTLVYQEKVLS